MAYLPEAVVREENVAAATETKPSIVTINTSRLSYRILGDSIQGLVLGLGLVLVLVNIISRSIRIISGTSISLGITMNTSIRISTSVIVIPLY